MTAPFGSYYRDFALHPVRAAGALARDERRVRFAFLAMLVPLLGYVLVYIGLARSGAYPSTFAPWLAIPAEQYYRYNQFLIAPSIVAAWLLASATVQLLARSLGGRGSFEDTAAGLAFAISVASWSLLPHDLAVALLGATHVIDGRAHEHAMNAPTFARSVLWFFMAVYMLAYPSLFVGAVRGVHSLGRARAAAVGVAGFAVYQLVFLVFNR